MSEMNVPLLIRGTVFDMAKQWELLLNGGGIKNGLARAINRTANTARMKSVTEVQKLYHLHNRDLAKRAIKVTEKAKPDHLRGIVRASGFRMPTSEFMTNTHSRTQGPMVNIKNGNKELKGAFVAPVPYTDKEGGISYHLGIFERVGTKDDKVKMKKGHYAGKFRQQIRQLFTVSIATATASEVVQNEVAKAMEKKLPVFVTQELNREVLTLAGKGKKKK